MEKEGGTENSWKSKREVEKEGGRERENGKGGGAENSWKNKREVEKEGGRERKRRWKRRRSRKFLEE